MYTTPIVALILNTLGPAVLLVVPFFILMFHYTVKCTNEYEFQEEIPNTIRTLIPWFYGIIVFAWVMFFASTAILFLV